MSSKPFRAALQIALQTLATGDLHTSATALLGKLGYASHKSLDLPTQPQAFTKEVESLLGGSKQLNPVHASLADWQSAAFLFQLTNDELPALAAGQMSLLTETSAVQTWQVESFVFLALDLKPGTWSRTRLATLTRELNTLLPIPRSGVQQDLLANPDVADKEAELRDANASHFAAKRFADKRKEKILRLRDELATLLKAELTLKPGDAERMTAWDPFDQNRHADFFEPEWMFGFQSGFDIVIGNPPYVRQESIKDDKPRFKPHYATYNGTADLYVYFYERSFQLVNHHGCLSFITSNRWFRAKYGTDLRQYMATHTEVRQIIDFGDEDVFDALAYPTIIIATKRHKPVSLVDATNDVAVLNWDGTNPNYRVTDYRLHRRVRRRRLCLPAGRKGQQPLAGAVGGGVSQIQRPGSRSCDARGAYAVGQRPQEGVAFSGNEA